MDQSTTHAILNQLEDRRFTLHNAISEVGQADDLVRLLADVDHAIERLATQRFGQCLLCDGMMDDHEMLVQPTRRYCLCELSRSDQVALQNDLDLAWQVQLSLLPQPNVQYAGWQAHYRYLPAGPVSGDYLDLITQESHGEWLYFLVGDVSGKGIASSYLMAHLSALARRILVQPVETDELIESLNQHMNQRTVDSHFVTLVAGRANAAGEVEITNAGHCPPVVIRHADSSLLTSNGLPIGVFEKTGPRTCRFQLERGESLLLYTDGISEARSVSEKLYGTQSLREYTQASRHDSPCALAAGLLDDVRRFQGGDRQSDDITVMVLRRA